MSHQQHMALMKITFELILSLNPDSSTPATEHLKSTFEVPQEDSDTPDFLDLLKYFSRILVYLERFKEYPDKVIELTSGMDNDFTNFIEALRAGGYPESDLTYTIVKRIVSVIICTIDHYNKHKQFNAFCTVEERNHFGNLMMIIISGYFGWDLEEFERFYGI